VNRPPPPQEDPPEEALPPAEEKLAAMVESFFSVWGLWQWGHSGRWWASEKRTILSKLWPQSEQRYS